MTPSMDEIRAKARHTAAETMMTLAERTARRGRTEVEPGKKVKPGWVVAQNFFGADTLIHPEKLREAVALYEIASTLDSGPADHGDYALYQKALLLEELGDFAEAEQAFRQSRYGNGQMLEININRCREKQQGAFDLASYMVNGMAMQMQAAGADSERMRKMLDKNASAEEMLGHANAWLGELMAQSNMAGADTSALELVSAMINSPPDDDDAEEVDRRELDEESEEEIIEMAQQFADLLLDKNYDEAKTMLHSSLADIGADELKASFEQLFEEDEKFPDTATVYSVDGVMSDRPDDDVAWVYVAIESENAEAVSFTVTREGDRLTLRELEWGRP
ncbi:MAG: hypothetical protein LBV49_13405 [Azonexus sp.]|jgi:tetratricopeptide (TPR) repeat protein|nr:hypothetical protein [Azonexus sp.]